MSHFFRNLTDSRRSTGCGGRAIAQETALRACRSARRQASGAAGDQIPVSEIPRFQYRQQTSGRLLVTHHLGPGVFQSSIGPGLVQNSTLNMRCCLLHFFCTTTACLLAAGCAGEKERVLLESRLRDQETVIRQLESRAAKAEKMLADQDRELAAMRADGHGPGKNGQVSLVSMSAESVAAWGSVESIQIHRLTSGILSESDRQLISVVVQPLDSDGELVKVAGNLNVTAAVMTSDGGSSVVAARNADITESRTLWSRTLVSSGFHVQLTPTETIDEGAELLLTAELNLGQGRKFSAKALLPGR